MAVSSTAPSSVSDNSSVVFLQPSSLPPSLAAYSATSMVLSQLAGMDREEENGDAIKAFRYENYWSLQA